jgi:hypothetical protein
MRAHLPASLLSCLAFTLLASAPGLHAQARGDVGRPSTPAPREAASAAKPAPTWPSASVLAERKRDAEKRPLFEDEAPVVFTLEADFKAVTRDRNPNSTKLFPATISFTDDKGATTSKTLSLRNRGHARRQVTTCDFPPIRLEFEKDAMAGTVFAGHRELKLGTHCRTSSEFEQYVLREYLAYRILNLITPQSFRVRLGKATYVDAVTKKPLATRYGLFIEDDDDVAKRMEGRVTELPNLMYRHFNVESATWFGLFEYLIGNTDVSIVSQHNVRTIETPASGRFVVPYDFDYSGIVGATYAIPNKQFGLASVKDRLYRGPCRTPDELEPFFVKLRTLKPQMLSLYETLPDLTDGYRRSAKNYLEDFYKVINDPFTVKKELVNGCVKSGI